jgi:hypothetical protein
MKSFTRALLGLLVLLAGLAACAAEPTLDPTSPRDYLYGRWVYKDPNQQAELVFEFKRDGTLWLGSEGVFLETSFEFVDDQTILVGQGNLEPIRMTWRVEGGSLTLINGDEVQVLQRREGGS